MAMRKRLGFIAGLLLAAISAQASAAQPSEQQVRQLMDVIGLGKSLSQMNTQVGTSMKQALPCVSSNYWENYIDENSSKDFIGRLVPIYQKHFTADEVDGMVRFYSSPLGQKVLTEMPLALAEANQAGQQWSHEHTQQMISKLEQAGTLGTNGRCPASAFAGNPASASSTDAASADTSGDEVGPAAAAVTERATASRRHGHVPIKKRTTTTSAKKKAVPTKKASSTRAPTKKGASAKTTPPAKTATKHQATAQKPASATHKATPAGQGTE